MHRDSVTGALTRFQVISAVNDENGTEAGSADIHITPSGEFLYASNRGSYNNIAAYLVDNQTGMLKLIHFHPVNGKTPRNFAIDPSGTFLLVADQDSDKVVTFRIDQVNGRLVDIGVETTIPAPVCLKFLPVTAIK
jgi:6-phosphogluconolactonase